MAQSFRAPDAREERHLRTILQALASGQPKATGRLNTELALGIDRRVFDVYLDALSRAGLVSISSDTFTNAEGTVISYKRATLTGEGREHTGSARAPLNLFLKDEETGEAATKSRKSPSSAKKTKKSFRKEAAPSEQRTFEVAPKQRSRTATRSPERPALARHREPTAGAAEVLTPEQLSLDQRLRDWRKSESEKLGLPQFFILGSSTLRSIVLNRPRTLAQLQTISGIGPEKAERYGPGILGVCTA